MELLLIVSSPICDFLSIPLMGIVKGGVLADSVINADVMCVVNHFTEVNISQGVVWQGQGTQL